MLNHLIAPALRPLSLATLLAACSSSGAQQTTNRYGAMEWDDSSTTASASDQGAMADALPLITGEQMIWEVSLFGLKLVRVTLAVGEPGVVRGRNVAMVRAQLETTGTAAVFSPVREQLTTLVDTSSAQPVYHRREFEMGRLFSWVEVEHVAPSGFAVEYRRRSEDHDTRDQQVLDENLPIFDANSFLVAARTWNLEPGERMFINVFREIYVWRFQLQRVADEVVKTPLGEFPAIRVDAIGRLLDRDGKFKDTVEPRKYSFWVSDDHQRLPLMLMAKTDYGDARMQLVHHARSASQQTPR